MAYNAKEIMEAKNEGPLGKDELYNGVIIEIQDGTVQDFVAPAALEKFNNKDSKAINLIVEVMMGDQRKLINQFYTYIDDDGITKYTSNSNLGKYVSKYDKAPEVGDQVKVISDERGYGSVKI